MLLAVSNGQSTVVNRAGSLPKSVRESSIAATLTPSSTGGFDGSEICIVSKGGNFSFVSI